jgi:hypothetical protein
MYFAYRVNRDTTACIRVVLRGHTLQEQGRTTGTHTSGGVLRGQTRGDSECVSLGGRCPRSSLRRTSHEEYEDDQGNLIKGSVLESRGEIPPGLPGIVSSSVSFESLTQINVYFDVGLYSDMPKLSMVSDEYYLADGFD